MTLGALLDVGLGILTIIILFSLAATALQESLAQTLRRRPRTLEDGLRTLIEARWGEHGERAPSALRGLNGRQLTQAFYRRPEVMALTKSPRSSRLEALFQKLLSIFGAHGPRRPSAIPPRVYAETMLGLMEDGDRMVRAAQADVSARGEAAAKAMETVLARLGAGEDVSGAPETVRMLTEQLSTGMGEAKAALDRRVEALEAEFNLTMDRVSGWYVRSTRVWLFAIGLALAIGANVDLLQYVRASLGDPALRARAVELAEQLGRDHAAREAAALEQAAEAAGLAAREGREAQAAELDPQVFEALAAAVREERASLAEGLEGLGAKVGWRCVEKPAEIWVDGWVCEDGRSVVLPNWPQVYGWFVIAFSVQLGAQFWFQLLKQLLALRTGGKITAPTPA
ncbi:MAG: hypothetical protein AAF676_02205 [Pseudomonadota bacterium]